MLNFYKILADYLYAWLFYFLIISIGLLMFIGNFDMIDFGALHLSDIDITKNLH
jgi:hypothetical protein